MAFFAQPSGPYPSMSYHHEIDAVRTRAGFLTVSEPMELVESGVIIFDPFSTLVSRGVEISTGVILWPGVTVEAGEGGKINIGEGAELYSGTRIVALSGRVSVGRGAEIGEEGGFTVRVDRANEVIEIGQHARLLGGGSATLDNVIGDGAQVLGPIRIQNCILASGGSHRETNPDKRGAVLKGGSVARGIELATGEVVQAFGLFSEGVVRKQSHFHPPVEQPDMSL